MSDPETEANTAKMYLRNKQLLISSPVPPFNCMFLLIHSVFTHTHKKKPKTKKQNKTKQKKPRK